MGPVWRNEKPGPGRFRQFYQCDADTVGSASVAADAEICAMLAAALEHAGIQRGDYLIRINNRKVLNGILDAMGVDAGPPADDVLRTIDKFDKIGEAGVRQLLTTGRKDESGAFIDGVGLRPEQADPVIAFLTSKGGNNAETLANLSDVLRKRAQMKLKIKAMSSEAKASAYIVGALPFFVFGVVWSMNPGYLQGFFFEQRLIVAGLGGLVWMSIGAFIMSRMISFEI